ncbi:MAG: DUF5916 domain-containing protein [Bacteroidota bacterium]
MKTSLTIGLLLATIGLLAQTPRELAAFRTAESIKIDGQLDEAAWQQAESTGEFITRRPNPGEAASEAVDLRVIYDDEGIYIGAMLYDSQPDSILRELTERDDLGNTDFFGVSFDPYQSGLNGFTFITTPGDVQFDARQTARNEDENWDAVWNSKTQITTEGWVAEMFIPFSALRFPKTELQTWTINFVRMIRRYNEQSFWDEIDPNVDGYLNQSGKLTGLEHIKAPFRLQLTPFVTAVGLKNYDPESNPSSVLGNSFGGGMDLKLGLSDAFTLDMTLIPDFSEARSDNNELNLGPFEQFFDEQRAFFTEGTELFNKGGLFYSRRVGGRLYDPQAVNEDNLGPNETVIDMPGRAQLVNATKISGRTANGTGIGFFNAIERRSYATVENLDGDRRDVQVHPRTNYNVLVVDQNLPNNSSITLINTNVLREGIATDANVTGLEFDLHNKANVYAISGGVNYSQRFLEEGQENGHSMSLRFSKISGNWQYRLWYSEESDTYNPNDLGLLFNNNERFYGGRVNYNYYEPFLNGFFLNGGAGLFAGHFRLYQPNVVTGNNVEAWVYGQTKGFWNVNFWTDHYPGWQYDYFEPRVDGRVFRYGGESNVGGWIGTDSRKKLRMNANFNYDNYSRDDQRKEFRFSVGARYRASDRMSLNAFVFRGNFRGDLGYVNDQTRVITEPDEIPYEHTDVFMGRRDRLITEVGLEGKYSFTANMTLNLRVRHYWDRVMYNSFHLLHEDGSLGATDYTDNHDVDFDAFNVDLIYRWRFAPGSDIFFVYKTNISAFDERPNDGYFNSLGELWRDAPSTQSVSLKVVYWLDYASVVN